MFNFLPIDIEILIYKHYFTSNVLLEIRYQRYKRLLTYNGYLQLSNHSQFII